MTDRDENDTPMTDIADDGDMSLLSASTDAIPATETESDRNIRGLPVSLEVSLPAVTVSLDMVRSMARGMTVPLGIDLSERVKIGINGKHFGEGTFVQIGDRIGIQVEDWKPARTH